MGGPSHPLIASMASKTGGGDDGPDTRIIPALAGNTPPNGNDALRCMDHPRKRGTYVRIIDAITDIRIIPALAGNTILAATSSTTTTDHPCARREHAVRGTQAATESGSSPRSRGTQELMYRTSETSISDQSKRFHRR